MYTSEVIYLGDLRTEAKHLASNHIIHTDAPIDNHGKGERFSPTDLLATSLAQCMITIMGIEASNNISESVHAMSTRNMQVFGTIRGDSCAAGGQQCSNDDWDRVHAALVRRRKQYDNNGNIIVVERDLGFFHRLHPKIQNAIIVAGRKKDQRNT